ncbi:PD-(D/E)XK nuclease family protein [Bacteroidota bacterium]
MEYFLKKVAHEIYNSYKEDLIDICVVLPNKRASLFLKNYLAEESSKPIFSPDFLSIEEFISKLSEFEIIDNMLLQFTLYEVHKDIEGINSKSFEDFLQTSSLMISDFNDIDTHLVDAGEIFNFLSETKAIAVWNLGEKELTDFEKRYLTFYRSLIKYYDKFREKLIKNNNAYAGIAYRKVAENIDNILPILKWKKIIFSGFNALSKSEETIIKSILDSGLGEVYWDSDEYYIQDKRQEAGFFLRDYFKQWKLKKINWIDNNITETGKKIHIIGTPKNVSQAKLAGDLLEKSKKSGLNTALILADENLLLPVLNSLPENIENFNVTMGFPFKFTPAYTLGYYWFSLFDEIIEDKEIGSVKLHKNSLINFLQHPYRKWFIRKSLQEQKPELDKLISSYRFYYSLETLKSFVELDFTNDNDQKKSIAITIANLLVDLIKTISHKISDQNTDKTEEITLAQQLDIIYLQKLKDIVERILIYSQQESDELSLNAFKTIFQRLSFQQNIPFYGEPLQGLQIMGMLESRTLDFDSIIMLSVNEGTLPAIKHANSLIPVDIRKKFGLPTQKEKQAIFAYHFYRLLQRSKEVFYIYNTEADDLGGGDKSRYIHQIEAELLNTNSKIDYSEKIVSFDLPKTSMEIISVGKTDDVLNAIIEKGQKGFSPSSISTYINCSLQFYFQYILGLEEIEEAEESIDAAMLGKIIHDSLQKLYLPLKGKLLTPDILEVKKENIKAALESSITKYYPEGETKFGKNLLILNIAFRMIEKLIKTEKEDLVQDTKIERKVLFLEEGLKKEIQISENGETYNIFIKGIVDRIDLINNEINIIDYKTGFVEHRELDIKEWDTIIDDPKRAKALQLLIYSWLFSDNADNQIQAAILSLRKLSNGLMRLKYPDKKNTFTPEYKSICQELIKTILESIFSKEENFQQTDDGERCKYCSFKTICNVS